MLKSRAHLKVLKGRALLTQLKGKTPFLLLFSAARHEQPFSPP